MRRRLLAGLIVLVFVLLAAYAVLASVARPAAAHAVFGPRRDVLVIAHQGGDGLWPGDTLVAFEHAAELGADVLEMDVHMSADGELVLMHDATVDRTTDGAGAITGLTLAELQALDAGYDWTPDAGGSFPYRGQGIRVPALREVLSAFPDRPLNIEIKQREPSLVAPFCALLREFGATDRVLVASFHDAALAEFRGACPEVRTSAGRREVETLFGLSLARVSAVYSPGFVAVQVPEYSSGLHVVTDSFVAAAHGRNIAVHPWTINSEEDLRRMLALGVDGIITDYPDRLLALLGR
jgi:glycerophosphoryl diester phosphodiesterase